MASWRTFARETAGKSLSFLQTRGIKLEGGFTSSEDTLEKSFHLQTPSNYWLSLYGEEVHFGRPGNPVVHCNIVYSGRESPVSGS